jgi:alpha-N-arabinofuranosidase
VVRASVAIDLAHVIGEADPMIYGHYLEHVQPEDRCVYGAVLDEGSPLADERGLRRDVVAAVRALGAPVVRWPGGCFADIYHWEDGIGPPSARPARRNWHWGGLEPNRFGTDEFLAWCEMTGATPYVNVNLGTGTLDEAVRWLDYCNGREPTHEVLRRRGNGRAEPYGVPFWGVGNEQWGDWEAGHMGAAAYAARLRNWTQFLRQVDPGARFLGVGSREAEDPEWDRAVLRAAGHLIDFLTLHLYAYTVETAPPEDEYYPAVTSPVFFEERLRRAAAIVAETMAETDRATPIRLSLDEWNVRHLREDPESGALRLTRSSPRTLQDVLVAAGVFHAMLRQAPTVGMACHVFLLNGHGVLLVGPEGIVKTPFYDLFWAYQHLLPPIVLDARVESEEVVTAVRQGVSGETATRSVPFVDVVAARDETSGRLGLAIVNRHRGDEAVVTVHPEGFACHGDAAIWRLFHEDPLAANDVSHPDRVRPEERTAAWSGTITVPPHSVTLVQAAVSR